MRHHDPRHPEQEVAAALPRAWRTYTGHVTTRRVTIFIFRSEFLFYPIEGGVRPAGQPMNNFLSRETSHAPLRRDMPNPYGITLNSSSFTMGRCGACRSRSSRAPWPPLQLR